MKPFKNWEDVAEMDRIQNDHKGETMADVYVQTLRFGQVWWY